MPKFVVDITTPDNEPITLEEMNELIHEGLSEVFGWRAFQRGYSYKVKEKK